MAKTSIEWATDVWNPVTGCMKVSQGCKFCFAERIANRFWGERKFTEVQVHPDRLEEPLHWKKPRRVFVNSMSDLFHEAVYEHAESFINEVFAIMAATPQHTYMVLTKRPVTMRNYLSNPRRDAYVEHSLETIYGEHGWCSPDFQWPLPNVWLGVSVENQQAADERIPLLLQVPAAVRFVSCEPLLGPVELKMAHYVVPSVNIADAWINWVICGGESGPGARPMHPDWARSLRDQCRAAGVPFFFKQWGEWLHRSQVDPAMQGELAMSNVFGKDFKYYRWPDDSDSIHLGKKAAGRLLDGQEYNEFPEVKG